MTDQQRRILLVDDNAAVGQLLKAGLEMYGFIARHETRSTDTIKACLDFKPDLVLLDIDMPVKDGGQVAAELRSHPTLHGIPIVFLSSLVTKEETGKQKASDAVFVSKQLPLADLVAKIQAELK